MKKTITNFLLACIFLSIVSTLMSCGGGESSESAEQYPTTYLLSTKIVSGVGVIQPATLKVAAGSSAVFNLTPEVGYVLLNVSGCNGLLSRQQYIISSVIEDCLISANFLRIESSFSISTSSSVGGSITPERLTLTQGGSGEFLINTAPGYTVSSIEGCNGLLDKNRYIVTDISGDCVIRVVFEEVKTAPTDLTFTKKENTAVLSWKGNATLGYKVYVAESSFTEVASSESEITEINSNKPSLILPLTKTYNHYFIRISAIYEKLELLSKEEIEIKHNFSPISSLNDTGITRCLTAQMDISSCSTSILLGQDAATGRDFKFNNRGLSKIGTGIAGFDFTKIDRAGAQLVIQDLNWKKGGNESEGTNWSCVRDNTTGLVWETKSDTGARLSSNQYTWFNVQQTENGGVSGSIKHELCSQEICNTGEYIKLLNRIKHCGSSNWRLPTRSELLNLIVNGASTSFVDSSFFPDTDSETAYWSSNTLAQNTRNAWAVSVNNGLIFWYPKSKPINIRLVHSK